MEVCPEPGMASDSPSVVSNKIINGAPWLAEPKLSALAAFFVLR
jgi:hypothetical protein